MTLENEIIKEKSKDESTKADFSKLVSENLKFNLFKREFSICKPLLLLKACLFLYYGAGSFLAPFLTVLFKVRGVSLNSLSFMMMVAPVIQTSVSAISGIIADKIGSSKPVFAANLIITMSLVLSIIFLPNVKSMHDDAQDIICDETHAGFVVDFPGVLENASEMTSCIGHDVLNSNVDACRDLNYTRLDLKVNTTIPEQNLSFYSVFFSNRSDLKPSYSRLTGCFMCCQIPSYEEVAENEYNGLIIAYACIYILYLATFSTSYRILDVTVMFMVTEHNSSFGHERAFAMLGNVLTPPLAGWIVDYTTPSGAVRNYNSALYFYLALCVAMTPFMYKMPMRNRPKGQNMFKKAIQLSKNPDLLAFFLLIVVLGTGFNTSRYFLYWYLEDLKANSLLIGLLTSVGALYGLPFLLTSRWWVTKIGAPQIFVLACVGYAINGIGYSIIQNPWYSLALESTSVLTYILFWVAAVEYSHDIAPEGLTATVISLAGAIHYSVGKLTSGLIGRFVMNSYGGAMTFRFLAASTLTAGALYSAFLCIRIKFKNKKYHIDTEKPENASGNSPSIFTTFKPTNIQQHLAKI